MRMQRIHYYSGLIIAIFVGLHLFNHSWSIFGVEKHIEIMRSLRHIYRNVLAETILFCAVLVQIYSGIKLFMTSRKRVTSNFDKLHIWSGVYLAVFFVIHLAAILIGRIYLNLDTNFYYSGTGLNTFPFNLFFIPYYTLAIFSFFGHIAAVHNKKMKYALLGLTPNKQSVAILIFAVFLIFVILLGQTNYFRGIRIPKEYYDTLIKN
ncbi:MAG TPA: hypothetical protein VGD22_06160 [Sphingobacteriaceae bacterium]